MKNNNYLISKEEIELLKNEFSSHRGIDNCYLLSTVLKLLSIKIYLNKNYSFFGTIVSLSKFCDKKLLKELDIKDSNILFIENENTQYTLIENSSKSGQLNYQQCMSICNDTIEYTFDMHISSNVINDFLKENNLYVKSDIYPTIKDRLKDKISKIIFHQILGRIFIEKNLFSENKSLISDVDKKNLIQKFNGKGMLTNEFILNSLKTNIDYHLNNFFIDCINSKDMKLMLIPKNEDYLFLILSNKINEWIDTEISFLSVPSSNSGKNIDILNLIHISDMFDFYSKLDSLVLLYNNKMNSIKNKINASFFSQNINTFTISYDGINDEFGKNTIRCDFMYISHVISYEDKFKTYSTRIFEFSTSSSYNNSYSIDLNPFESINVLKNFKIYHKRKVIYEISKEAYLEIKTIINDIKSLIEQNNKSMYIY